MLLCAVMSWAQGGDSCRTGILLVHYGTQNDNSRRATIDRIDSIVAARFTDCKVREAYAAPTVIKALAKRGIRKLSISQALDSMKADGCRRVVVQTTMLLDGVMTDMLKTELKRVAPDFASVALGRPLLYSVADCRAMLEMIARNIAADKGLPSKNVQVVLVGHGSDSPANAIYSQIDYLAKAEGRANWHVGTIEGYPAIGDVERQLSKSECRNVILVPLLYIAGNHQREDIDGVWRLRLADKGYKVSVVSRGLGEMREIQNMIVDRIQKLKDNDE